MLTYEMSQVVVVAVGVCLVHTQVLCLPATHTPVQTLSIHTHTQELCLPAAHTSTWPPPSLQPSHPAGTQTMRLLVLRVRRTQPVQPLLVVDSRLAVLQAGADLADMLGYTTKELRALTLPGERR